MYFILRKRFLYADLILNKNGKPKRFPNETSAKRYAKSHCKEEYQIIKF